MKDSSYSRFQGTNLILRDELAIDRTFLANERTLLAYLRAAVALIIAGVTIIHYADVEWFWGVGVASIPLGVLSGIVGVVRYRRMNRDIHKVRQQADREAENSKQEEA